eukprot:SM000044S16054  [mRNA]  locus=s44:766990:771936:- [translate_table: standard]
MAAPYRLAALPTRTVAVGVVSPTAGGAARFLDRLLDAQVFSRWPEPLPPPAGLSAAAGAAAAAAGAEATTRGAALEQLTAGRLQQYHDKDGDVVYLALGWECGAARLRRFQWEQRGEAGAAGPPALAAASQQRWLQEKDDEDHRLLLLLFTVITVPHAVRVFLQSSSAQQRHFRQQCLWLAMDSAAQCRPASLAGTYAGPRCHGAPPQDGPGLEPALVRTLRVLQAGKDALQPFFQAGAALPPLTAPPRPLERPKYRSPAAGGSGGPGFAGVRQHSHGGVGAATVLLPGSFAPTLIIACYDDAADDVAADKAAKPAGGALTPAPMPLETLPTGSGSTQQPGSSADRALLRRRRQLALEAQLRLVLKRCRITAAAPSDAKDGLPRASSGTALFALDPVRAVLLLPRTRRARRPAALEAVVGALRNLLASGKQGSGSLPMVEADTAGGGPDKDKDEDVQLVRDFVAKQAEALRSPRGGPGAGRLSLHPRIELPLFAAWATSATELAEALSPPAAARKRRSADAAAVKSTPGLLIRRPTVTADAAMTAMEASTGLEAAFSQHWCAQELPAAFALYSEGLPLLYPTRVHAERLESALKYFEERVRGPELPNALAELSRLCRATWVARRQCDAESLTGRPCMLAAHCQDASMPGAEGANKGGQLLWEGWEGQLINGLKERLASTPPSPALASSAELEEELAMAASSASRMNGEQVASRPAALEDVITNDGALRSSEGGPPTTSMHSSGAVYLRACPCGAARKQCADAFDIPSAKLWCDFHGCCTRLSIDAEPEPEPELETELAKPTAGIFFGSFGTQQDRVVLTEKSAANDKADASDFDPCGWSLVLLGRSSAYSPAKGLQQEGFCKAANILEVVTVPPRPDAKPDAHVAASKRAPITSSKQDGGRPTHGASNSILSLDEDLAFPSLSSSAKQPRRKAGKVHGDLRAQSGGGQGNGAAAQSEASTVGAVELGSSAYVGFEHECPFGHRYLLHSDLLTKSVVDAARPSGLAHDSAGTVKPAGLSEVLAVDAPGSRDGARHAETVQLPLRGTEPVQNSPSAHADNKLVDVAKAQLLVDSNLPMFLKCPFCKSAKEDGTSIPDQGPDSALYMSQLQRIYMVTPPRPHVFATKAAVHFQPATSFSLAKEVVLPPGCLLCLKLPSLYISRGYDGLEFSLLGDNNAIGTAKLSAKLSFYAVTDSIWAGDSLPKPYCCNMLTVTSRLSVIGEKDVIGDRENKSASLSTLRQQSLLTCSMAGFACLPRSLAF